jgi:SWI/SNF-related matrix-associated actin-dependent regulator of chromatin subfamily A-like protein 1
MPELFPYQQEGVDFLAARPRAYNADDMGLGKTVQACAAAALFSRRTLVVAPASALPNWYREWQVWGNSGSFAAVSYDRLVRRQGEFEGRDWDVVILDEAHYTKTRGAKRTIAALTLARDAQRCWLLSGTPMPNHPGELWAPLRALWPGVPRQLGIERYSEWLDRFCRWTPSIYGPKIWGGKNLEQLKPYLRRLMIRRRLEDVGMQLPPLRVDVHLLPNDGSLDAALAQQELDPASIRAMMRAEELQGEEASLSRLRRLLGSLKAAAVGELVAEELKTRQYRKVVVLAHHHATLDILRRALEPYDVVGFTGKTPAWERQAAIDDFQLGAARVFLGQQTAAGIAINLQAASEIVIVEPAWSPDDNAQAIKRVHRIGSERPVRARIFALAGTLDEDVMQVTARKTRMQVDLGLQPCQET